MDPAMVKDIATNATTATAIGIVDHTHLALFTDALVDLVDGTHFAIGRHNASRPMGIVVPTASLTAGRQRRHPAVPTTPGQKPHALAYSLVPPSRLPKRLSYYLCSSLVQVTLIKDAQDTTWHLNMILPLHPGNPFDSDALFATALMACRPGSIRQVNGYPSGWVALVQLRKSI